MRRFGLIFVTTTALSGLCSSPAVANPIGGVVSAGAASIASAGPTLTVTQSSNKAVIDWRSFNIAQNETTDFIQPSSSAIALNRINDVNPSVIEGNLDANGHIILINPNGVLFTGSAKVDVGGITATTANISNSDFMAGNFNFSQPGIPSGAIVNQGIITVEQAGLASLVAPQVENDGVITAKLGKVNLASGDTFTLDLAGDGKLQVAVSGTHLPAQTVVNNGAVSANGGSVTLTAAAASDLVNSLIVNTGVIQATTEAGHPGSVTLYAEGSNAVQGNVALNKGQKQGTSTVMNSGIIDASGYGTGETGGSISVLGDNVGILSGSFIDASGDAGGGFIKIGGDFHGAGTTPTAVNTYVDANALIMANANTSGSGGNVAVWSDGNTWFEGNILAEGGSVSGNGGYVETSGHGYLDANGYVDTSAPNGSMGTWLLDPTNIYVYGNFTPAYTETINGDSSTLASNLKLWLDASDTGNVTLTYNSTGTTATGSSGGNTITVGSNSGLVVGERIQIGGSSDSFAASVNDNSSDGIYTISNISGTTITLDANLGNSYSGATLYGGFVSTLTDKSGQGNTVSEATTSRMPLWISNAQNGIGEASFSNDWLSASSSTLPTGSNASSIVTMFSANSTSGAIGGWGANSASGDRFDVYTPSGVEVENQSLGGAVTAGISTNTPYIFANIYSGGNLQNSTTYLNGASSVASSPSNATPNVTNTQILIGSIPGAAGAADFSGKLGDYIVYNTNLSTNAQALVNQYESAKWGIALTGPGNATGESGLTGAEAQSAMASTQAGATTDGYSVFTTGYLNRLSQTSNIILQAGNNVTLDFQGGTLSLASGKSLTLTAGNQITTASTGTISTSNGAINLNATSGIVFNNDFTINSGGGNITFNGTVDGAHNLTVNSGSGTTTFDNAVGGTTALSSLAVTSTADITLDGNVTTSGTQTYTGPVVLGGNDTLTTTNSAVDFTSTVDGTSSGSQSLTVNAGNTGSVTFTGQIGSTTGLGALSVTAGGGITLNAATATSISLNSSGGSGNIASNNSGILDATSGTITVNSGGDIDFSNIAQETSNQVVSDTAVGNAYLNAINSGTGSLTVNANNVYLYGGGLASPTNLVGYWNFNEGSGTTATDDSGNGNTGTINGATYSTSTPTGSGYSLSFNGTSNYVVVPDSTSLEFAGAYTVSAWIDLNNYGTFRPVVLTFRRSLREFPLDFRGSCRAVAVPANGSPVRPIWDF